MKLSRPQLLLATLAMQFPLLAQASLERRDGLIPMLWDPDQGKLLFEISQLDKDYLYFATIAKGSGSGSVGLEWAGGGQNYVVKGETLPPTEIVPVAKQREILGLLLETLEPANLAIPESLLASLTVQAEEGPRQFSGGSDLENFSMSTGYAFDQLSAARTVAGLVFDQLFEPEKTARLISFADRQPGALTLPEVIDAATKKVWGSPAQSAQKSIQRQTQRAFLDALMTLGTGLAATPDVRAVVMAALVSLRAKVAEMKDADAVTEAHLRQSERDLAKYIQNPVAPKKSAAPPPIMVPI
jgi:hypothetical protein